MVKDKDSVNASVDSSSEARGCADGLDKVPEVVARLLQLPKGGVRAVIGLLKEGATVPFISRYRKEATGSLDEVQVEAIESQNARLEELVRRRASILSTIASQNALTPDLEKRISDCWDPQTLEDLYLPFKPKKRTRAEVAREKGLGPLADLILAQGRGDLVEMASGFLNDKVASADDAVAGASDIIAEAVAEDSKARNRVRNVFERTAVISSKLVKAKADDPEAQKFADYFDFSEPLKKCSSHRLLAIRRGEAEGFLRVDISPLDLDACRDDVAGLFVSGSGPLSNIVRSAANDGFKRLLKPSIESEFSAISKSAADEEAVKVFALNLRQLLLSAPLGQKSVLALDPGFRTGCKVVCLGAQGQLLCHTVIYPHPPHSKVDEAARIVMDLVGKYSLQAVAIGNGTASRETEQFVSDTFARSFAPGQSIPVYVVSENGASVYSASAVAREEFPNEDVTVRGAVSIGRRLIDPLAELVKIDPKSIGVGQYQHDVDQAMLKRSLDQTVVSCVNQVGVDVNTASRHLLAYVSGLGPALAQNIVDYRTQNGPFGSRSQLKKVKRLGDKAFEQCAGFLRIRNGKNPLDNSAVHPESYSIVEAMASDAGCSVADLIANASLRKNIDIGRYVTDKVGLPTLSDILHELEKPGLDPRASLEAFAFDQSVHTLQDLHKGMVLPGIVTNITNFGAFVDIGVHQDGLVHVSQIADRYVSSPTDAVSLHQHVRVRVEDVDLQRGRISLSMKNLSGGSGRGDGQNPNGRPSGRPGSGKAQPVAPGGAMSAALSAALKGGRGKG